MLHLYAQSGYSRAFISSLGPFLLFLVSASVVSTPSNFRLARSPLARDFGNEKARACRALTVIYLNSILLHLIHLLTLVVSFTLVSSTLHIFIHATSRLLPENNNNDSPPTQIFPDCSLELVQQV